MSIHHCKDKLAVLTDVRRILKPGGHLFFKEHDIADSDTELIAKHDAELDTDTLSPKLENQPNMFISRDVLASLLIDELFFIHCGDSVDRLPPGEAETNTVYHSLYQKQPKKEKWEHTRQGMRVEKFWVSTDSKSPATRMIALRNQYY